MSGTNRFEPIHEGLDQRVLGAGVRIVGDAFSAMGYLYGLLNIKSTLRDPRVAEARRWQREQFLIRQAEASSSEVPSSAIGAAVLQIDFAPAIETAEPGLAA